MASATFLCQDCQKKYEVNYYCIKPRKVQCPHCGSSSAQEQMECNTSCRDSRDENKWRGFT